MPGDPVVAKLKKRSSGPFNPSAKLDASQVVDKRVPTPMDYVHYEDGTAGFVTDPNTGARLPSAGTRKWIPLPPQGRPVGSEAPRVPEPTGGGGRIRPKKRT